MRTRTIPWRGRRALILLPIVALLVGACSSSAVPSRDAAEGLAVDDNAMRQAPEAAPISGAPLADTSGAASGQEGQDRSDGRLIIRTGQLDLEVKDVGTSVPRARAVVEELGGYVSASDTYDYGDSLAATITYRIPADRWQDAIDALRGLSERVVREATQAQEVTSQVVDLKARITNLRASEAALIEIMDGSGSIEDVLAVQQRLSDVRGEIEQLVAAQQDLEGRAALATLTVTWTSPMLAVVTTAAGWDIGSVVDAAAAQTVAAGQTLASVLVWLVIVGIPVFGVPLLVLAVAAVVVRRRFGGRSVAAPPAGPDAPGGAAA